MISDIFYGCSSKTGDIGEMGKFSEGDYAVVTKYPTYFSLTLYGEHFTLDIYGQNTICAEYVM